MTSWDGGGSCGRPSQSAPSSRKTSPNLKGISRIHNTSPPRTLAASSPRGSLSQTSAYPSHMSSTKERKMSENVSGESVRYRHYLHRQAEQDNVDYRHCEGDVQEDVRLYYENLLRGKDDLIKKLERKVEYLQREIACIRQSKDKEIDILRQNVECSSRMAEDEFEKRLNETITEAEKQKVTLHREHTRRIQELLETTNKRLQKMEESYGDRISYLTSMVDELECKLTTLSKEMEQSLIMKNRLKEEREQLEHELCCLQDKNMSLDHEFKETLRNYEMAKDKICQLEMGKASLEQMSQKTLEDTRKRLECEIQILKEKNEEDQLQFKCKIASLEQTIDSLKECMKQLEASQHQQLKNVENEHEQRLRSLEQQHKKEIQEMQREIDVLVCDYSSRSQALELSISEKERQVCQLKSQMQAVAKEYDDKLKHEKETLLQYEMEIRDKDSKIKTLCEELTELTKEKEQQVNSLYCQMEEQKRIHSDEIRALTSNIQRSQRHNELQSEDAIRLLEEEKRLCDEKVSKVSEQLKQSICLYEKEAKELSELLEKERKIHCDQIGELSEQVHQAKRLQQRQSEEFICQLEEEKLQFRKQIQDLSRQVDLFRTMCEKQSRDYAQQIDDERKLHQEEITQIRCHYEIEKQDLCIRHQKEMEALKRDPQSYILCLEEKFTKLLTEAEDKAWEQEQCYLKKISEMEHHIHQLHCDRARGMPSSGHSSLRRHTTADLSCDCVSNSQQCADPEEAHNSRIY